MSSIDRPPQPPPPLTQEDYAKFFDALATSIRFGFGAFLFIKGLLDGNWVMVGVGILVMQNA